jgi:hypothetical protein
MAGRRRAVKDETALEEALQLSQQEGAALEVDDDDLDGSGGGYLPEPPPYDLDDDDGDYDEDIDDLNNPNVETFGEPPLLGTQGNSSDIFGEAATTMGRATSPKLYAQASQFPTAVQFRVWRWENGIPVALGAIDAEASEDDFIKKFYTAMPQPGDERFQFKFRPVDVNGKELGKEFTKNISEHHAAVSRIRARKEREREENMGQGHGHSEPILINQGEGGGAYAEEMGRMFEHAVESAERRTELLQETLEQERERLREEEKSRYQERAALADRSTDVVQKMTERLMETDRSRSTEALKAQEAQSGLIMQTLTTVFSQQQEAARQQAERLREADEIRMRQDREFFDRQRQESETKRGQDQQDYERKIARDREEADRALKAASTESERKSLQEKQEGDRRIEAERHRIELEGKRIEEQRKFDLEQLRMDSEKREREAERRREAEREEARRQDTTRADENRRREQDLESRRAQEKEEAVLKVEREKLEMERQRQLAAEERERWRTEMEDKRRTEREEWERKQTQLKDDAERRERMERERLERERQDFTLRMERERQEREDSAARRTEQSKRDEDNRREEARRTEEARKAEVELKVKQMEIEADRARQHQEKMAEQARLDRESRSAAESRRDALEREAREAADRDRQRQHDMQMRGMEMDKERDREHQERMIQLQKIQSGEGGGGLSGIIETLGLEAPELLERLFSPPSGENEDGGSWSDAIPKVLGSIAELGKAAITAKSEQSQQVQARGRRRVAPAPESQTAQVIQTPDGPQVILPGQTTGIPLRARPVQQPQPVAVDLPESGSVPEEYQNPAEQLAHAEAGEPTEEAEESPSEPVNTLARAKKAGISLRDQKKARKAVRSLLDKLSESEQEEWLGLITEAITAEVGIYYYIRAVTVSAALAEATDDEELHTAVITALRESDLIPEDVPYEEADFAQPGDAA